MHLNLHARSGDREAWENYWLTNLKAVYNPDFLQYESDECKIILEVALTEKLVAQEAAAQNDKATKYVNAGVLVIVILLAIICCKMFMIKKVDVVLSKQKEDTQMLNYTEETIMTDNSQD
jgi:hypothetical protein